MCICIYVYMYICIHVYMYMYIQYLLFNQKTGDKHPHITMFHVPVRSVTRTKQINHKNI